MRLSLTLRSEAFLIQLDYAQALAEIGEPDRADAQFDLALSSVADYSAFNNDVPSYMEAPELLREQAVALEMIAAKLHGGRAKRAESIAEEATAKLEESTRTPNSPGVFNADLFRSTREPQSIIRLAGSLADIGQRYTSEAWRERVSLDLNTYGTHLEVLERQKSAQPEGGIAIDWIVELQEEIIISAKEGVAVVLGEERRPESFKLHTITGLHLAAQACGLETDISGLLETYATIVGDDRFERVVGFGLEETDEYTRRPVTPIELEREYNGLAEAYAMIGDTEKSQAMITKTLPMIEARRAEGDDEAKEDLVFAYLDLDRLHEVEPLIQTIALRHRMRVREIQAWQALDAKDVARAFTILDTGATELAQLFAQDEPDDDEYETGMGLKFAKMLGDIGQYDQMDST